MLDLFQVLLLIIKSICLDTYIYIYYNIYNNRWTSIMYRIIYIYIFISSIYNKIDKINNVITLSHEQFLTCKINFSILPEHDKWL